MYKLIKQDTSIMRLSDNASIPADPRNTDYAAYLQWLSEGNTPTPADPIIIPIPNLTPRQVRLVLTQAGLRAQVEAAVAASDQNTKDTWEFSTMIERNNPMLIAMATGLGMTSVQLDEMFIAGALL